ncbi:glyoxalase/bleomycin resistance protein/dioxygenase superfamily protein [Mobilisporobacter senegalensis]|uniref:Glyoxalase/bleomycin resistance protein/dioxygenase superfamily protein n=1 Tax=Mobilisporobacter senegalensis TaxID=1329262 RepID=A0A3N1XRI2_9FIRM|nr:glyoxalase/bleomycin resistance protein/dioxygenase superfamily protein [Mobilisporobacter senegalensis]
MIQSIVHIALVVKDYDEAIEFYTKKLHFQLIEDIYQPEQDVWLQCLKIYTEICGICLN